jgi:hypothetical protein
MLIVQSLGILFRGLTVHCRCLSRYGKHRVKESCLLPPKRILLSAGPCFAKDMWRWGGGNERFRVFVLLALASLIRYIIDGDVSSSFFFFRCV